MITAIRNAVAAWRTAARRAEARREVEIQASKAYGLFLGLYMLENPAARAELLRQHAACERRIAELCDLADPVAAPMLRASADLFDLVAMTEDVVAHSEWEYAGRLESGETILAGATRFVVADIVPNDMRPELLHLRFTCGAELIMGETDSVRTAGPWPDEVFERTRRQGAKAIERAMWWELATTRDRNARADLLCHLARLAAERIDPFAADSLIGIGDTEIHHAADPGGPVPVETVVLSHEARR